MGVLAGSLVSSTPPASSITIDAFRPRFQTNDNGAIRIFGNNVLTCPASVATCAGSRNGTVSGAGASNNGYSMVNLDVDSDPTTFNSSSSDTVLPSGITVLFAALYWGARSTGASGGVATSAPIGRMLLKAPGDAAYRTIATQQQYGPTAGDGAYQQFADVTGIVQSAGGGPYWGANVAAGTGNDRYGGWSLVVAYRDPTQPLRNLTVFNGFSDVAVNSSETIPITGFLAPLNGPVDARLGMVAYEGDKGATGDSAFLNQTRLATALSPGTNFFDSAADLDGNSVPTRNPPDVNMLGFDIKQLGVPGAIPNGARNATVTLSTTSERYFIGVVTTQINLYAPDFTPSRKAVTNLSGRDPAASGDTLEYTLTYVNAGQDPAAGSIAVDPLPAGTTFVPGSLEVLTGPNAGVKTDATGDDQVEYDAGARLVRARLGTGAGPTLGGVLAPGVGTAFRFQVTVDPGASGTTLVNEARLGYTAQTIGSPFTYEGNQTVTPVVANADLRVAKQTTPDPAAAGAAITSTLTVANDGPNVAEGVVVTDSLSEGVAAAAATSTIGTCAVAGQDVTCSIGSLAAGATATITVTGAAPSSAVITSFTNLASASSSTADPDPADNTVGASVGVERQADVVVEKRADPTTVAPGGFVTFTLTARNLGPSDAEGVRVSDTLDARFGSPTANGPCEVQGNAVDCQFATLTPGASATATITAQVDPSLTAGIAIANEAQVSSQTPDPSSANNVAATPVTTSAPQADLSVTKVPVATTVTAGIGAAYSITVTNNGPSDAAGVIVTDPLAPALSFRSASSSRGVCVQAVPVSCTVGDLPAGASATISVILLLTPDAPTGPLTNTASATSSTADPDPADNNGATTVEVVGSADLVVTKTGAPSPIVVGSDVTYTVTVTNQGPSVSRAVALTEQLPAAFTFEEATTPPGGACNAPVSGALTCQLGDLAVGASLDVLVRMNVPPDFPGGDVTNSATASAATPDPRPAAATASYTSSTTAQSDVSVTKALTSAGPPTAGAPVTWTVEVTNDGPAVALGVNLVDTVPASLTNATLTGPGCSSATRGCAIGTLAAGATATVTVSGVLSTSVALGDSVVNVASVTSTSSDPTASNNVATTSTLAASVAELTVVKTTDTPSAPAGAGLPTFTITVANAGPSIARGVRVTDALPFDAIIEAATGGTCTTSGVAVDCDLADLAPGTSAAVVITYFTRTSVPPGPYTNVATASTSTSESDLANNSGSLTVTVEPPSVDVTVAKSGPTSLVAGERFEYSIDVQNGGPSTAFDVIVTDTLPAGLVPDVATASFGRCRISGQTVTCDLAFVYEPPFEQFNAPVVIGGTVAPDAPDQVTNTATAASVEPDAAPGNNTDATSTPVERQAGLRLTKQADSAAFVAGGDVVYTLSVTNAGPSVAQTVTLLDQLPAGVTLSAELSSPGCVRSGGAGPVSCNLGAVAVGETRVILLGGTLDPLFAGVQLVNQAEVATGQDDDPDPSDNVASVTTPVGRLADLGLTKTPVADTAAAGGPAQFVLTATNQGPSAAEGVTLSDPVPAGATVVSVVTEPDRPCTTAVTCDIGTLAPGESFAALVTLTVDPSLPAGALTNSARLDSPTPDPRPERRLATAALEVVLTADLTITKTLSTSPIVAGQPVSYTFSVVNAGPSNATNVTITDALPAGTTFVSGDLSGSPCLLTDIDAVPTVSCVLASLAVGQTATGTLTLATDPALTGELSNTAVVGAEAIDREDAGNTSTATGTVQQATTTTTATTLPGASTTLDPATSTVPDDDDFDDDEFDEFDEFDTLPDAGADLVTNVAAGLALLATGLAVWAVSRRPRRPRHS